MSKNQNIKCEINQLIQEYADIRKKFEKRKEKHPRYLKGNDNYVGITGEYWATIFLEQEYESAIKYFLDEKEEERHCNSQEWFDFELDHGENSKKELISVKAISSENKKGRSGIIKYFSRGEDILSVIIIKLGVDLKPEQLLYIKNLNSNLDNEGKCNYSNNWKKSKKSLAFRYYRNKDDEKKNGFDEIFTSKKECSIWEWNDDKFVQK